MEVAADPNSLYERFKYEFSHKTFMHRGVPIKTRRQFTAYCKDIYGGLKLNAKYNDQLNAAKTKIFRRYMKLASKGRADLFSLTQKEGLKLIEDLEHQISLFKAMRMSVKGAISEAKGSFRTPEEKELGALFSEVQSWFLGLLAIYEAEIRVYENPSTETFDLKQAGQAFIEFREQEQELFARTHKVIAKMDLHFEDVEDILLDAETSPIRGVKPAVAGLLTLAIVATISPPAWAQGEEILAGGTSILSGFWQIITGLWGAIGAVGGSVGPQISGLAIVGLVIMTWRSQSRGSALKELKIKPGIFWVPRKQREEE